MQVQPAAMITCRLSHLEARCQERGYTLDEVRPCIVREDGDSITVDETHPAYPRSRPGLGGMMAAVAPAPGHPCKCGTELKSLLKDWLGIKASPTCSCSSMARRMDSLGPDWCEGEGMASILDVMRVEHAKRWSAGKTVLPWTDAGARQLVLLACRRSRSKAAKNSG